MWTLPDEPTEHVRPKANSIWLFIVMWTIKIAVIQFKKMSKSSLAGQNYPRIPPVPGEPYERYPQPNQCLADVCPGLSPCEFSRCAGMGTKGKAGPLWALPPHNPSHTHTHTHTHSVFTASCFHLREGAAYWGLLRRALIIKGWARQQPLMSPCGVW